MSEAEHELFRDTDKLAESLREASREEYIEALHLLAHNAEAATIVRVLPVIVDRFQEELKAKDALAIELQTETEKIQSDEEYREFRKNNIQRFGEMSRRGAQAKDIGDFTRYAIWSVATDPSVQVDKEIIDKMYSGIHSDSRTLAYETIEALDNLIVLDNRNAKQGEGVGLFDRYHQDTLQALLHPYEGENLERGKHLVDVAWASFPSHLENLLLDGIDQAETPEARKNIWRVLSNRMEFARARKQAYAYAEVHPDFMPKLKAAEAAIGLDKLDDLVADLRELYDRINFKEYKPNAKLNDADTAFILTEVGDAHTLLDIGAGTGRLMESLSAKGKHVIGFDYVRVHAQQIKIDNPEADIAVASWHAMPYKDRSVDAAYCLGRSILHNRTVEDMQQFFREAHRVLKEDGVLLVDTPDPEKGLYKVAREQIARMAEQHGIQHYEEGLIHDSPDGKHFFDRFAPGAEQFKAIAALAGFEAEIVKHEDYNDSEGYENTNWYWKLKKRDKPLTFDEMMDQLHASRTSSAPIELTWL